MIVLAEATSISRIFPNLMPFLTSFPFKTTKITSLIAISLVLLVLLISSSTFNVYAQQQGGSVTTRGIIISGTCNAPQATGGAAASGAATGGSVAGSAVTNISALVDKGNALLALGMYPEAIRYYDKALTIDPSNKFIIFNIGNALESLGNYTQAIQYFDRALAIDL